jgi:hypothetical protein
MMLEGDYYLAEPSVHKLSLPLIYVWIVNPEKL